MAKAKTSRELEPNWLEANSPVEIWSQYEGLTQSKFWQEFINRLTADRDMHCYVTAASETGVGKTTLAFALCILGDMTGWKIEKATLDPAEYSYMYDRKELCENHSEEDDLSSFENCRDCEYYLKPGSWLLGDEWEQAVDARRSMSKGNLETSHDVATKRYRQIFSVWTLPSKSWMDKRFSADAADYWIQAQETPKGKPKGEAIVYRLRSNEHYEQDYTTRQEVISWPVLDDHPLFQKLTRKKQERMEGRTLSKYIHRDEFKEAKKNFWKKATKKARFEFINGMYDYGFSQREISDILEVVEENGENIEGLTQQRISTLVNADGFEDVYKK